MTTAIQAATLKQNARTDFFLPADQSFSSKQ